jgi:hypothetical protein
MPTTFAAVVESTRFREELEASLWEAVELQAPRSLVRQMYQAYQALDLTPETDEEIALHAILMQSEELLSEWDEWVASRRGYVPPVSIAPRHASVHSP